MAVFLRYLIFAKLDFTVNNYLKMEGKICIISKICYNKIRKSFFV